MKTHEYQARELLRQYGIAVPEGVLARTAQEAAAAAALFGGRAMVKAQVLTGGRGKAGAIRAVSSKEQAETAAREILAMSVNGFPVRGVLVTERLDIQAEYYAGITIDREARSVVLMLSAAGGMDIEEIAAREPQKVRRFTLSGGVEPYRAEALAKWLSTLLPDRTLHDQAAATIENMYRLFREKDCSLVEINPLAVCSVPGRACPEPAEGASEETPYGVTTTRLVAADAKIVFDDNGLARHPELAVLRNPEEYTPEELEAKEAGLSFVSLSGDIGCMVNGAGLAMATMDGIKLAGGSPANFLDVGGSSNPQKTLAALRILLRNQRLKAILVNIFGGITRCDDIAQGILLAREQLRIAVPMVIRLVGTNDQEGREMLQRAGLLVARGMTDAIEEAVRCARGGVRP